MVTHKGIQNNMENVSGPLFFRKMASANEKSRFLQQKNKLLEEQKSNDKISNFRHFLTILARRRALLLSKLGNCRFPEWEAAAWSASNKNNAVYSFRRSRMRQLRSNLDTTLASWRHRALPLQRVRPLSQAQRGQPATGNVMTTFTSFFNNIKNKSVLLLGNGHHV